MSRVDREQCCVRKCNVVALMSVYEYVLTHVINAVVFWVVNVAD